MTSPSRRTVIAAGAAAATALAAVRSAAASAVGTTNDPAEPVTAGSARFRHGVASGDPLGTAVVLWTRVTPVEGAVPGSGRGGPVDVTWEVAGDAGFSRILERGVVRTDASRDHTVKVDVRGLAPYTRYHYRFRALGASSPVGRTQTAADDGRLHALRLAFVSCSNWTGGYFQPYQYVSLRDDLDLVVHLGDYLYEYGNGGDRYGPESLAGRRDHVPGVEMTTLQQYRARHGQYKTDPSLQSAHAAHPWVVVFDDHEVTNDSYEAGAENHTPGAEGEWEARRRQAYRAYLEWMPLRLPDQGVPHQGTRFWRRFSFGPLADLSVIETRQNRSRQAESGSDSETIGDPDRVLVEREQMAWLTKGIASTSARWHLLANQVVFTRVQIQPGLPGQELLGPLGFGTPVFNPDQWDGYQDDQREVTAAMERSASDTVVLTGDIHSSWANEIPVDPGTYRATGDSAAVEFVCPSVTSDGFREVLGSEAAAEATTTALQVSNPNIKYLNGIGHGYAVLDVTPTRVQTDFWFISDREDKRATQRLASSWRSAYGTRKVTAAARPIGPRSDRPRTPGASS